MLLVEIGIAPIKPAEFVVFAQIVPAHVRSTGVWITNLQGIPATIVFGIVTVTLVTQYGLRGGMFAAAARSASSATAPAVAGPSDTNHCPGPGAASRTRVHQHG